MTTHPPPEPPVHRERAARTWVGTAEEIATFLDARLVERREALSPLGRRDGEQQEHHLREYRLAMAHGHWRVGSG